MAATLTGSIRTLAGEDLGFGDDGAALALSVGDVMSPLPWPKLTERFMAGPDYDAGLEKFAPARRNDLISGAGLAVTYVGGVNAVRVPWRGENRDS
jgi:hypothetical protein